MNILITGIHGFIGSNITEFLKNSHRIYGLDIISPEKEGVVKTYLWSDLKLNNLPAFDAIIHLAGKAHDTKNQSAAQEYFDINTELTKKIFDYFLDSSAQKFIFFSSVKAAADFVPGDILTEDIIPAPVGPYGESKIAAETYINSRLSTFNAQLSKDVYILRPCMIHGPGNKGNLNLLYNIVNRGIPWPLGAFENRRSFASIDNVSYIISELLKQDLESGTYHIADDEALSTNELIETMCETLGRKTRIWKINKGLMESCARIGDKTHLPLNTERLHKLTENYVVSNTKIKKGLDIDKMPVTAREGLIKTIQSFKIK